MALFPKSWGYWAAFMKGVDLGIVLCVVGLAIIWMSNWGRPLRVIIPALGLVCLSGSLSGKAWIVRQLAAEKGDLGSPIEEEIWTG
jgi:hypothetical protein